MNAQTFTAEDRQQARALLRERWGAARNLTRADYAWLTERIPEVPCMTAIEATLRIAGLWDEYRAANFPKWEDFRAWIRRIAP